MIEFCTARGELRCVFVEFRGFKRNEQRAVTFGDNGKIPDVTFSKGERLSITLGFKKESHEFLGVTQWRQRGTLHIGVFLPENRINAYTGDHNFEFDPHRQKQVITLDNVSLNHLYEGSVGRINIVLELEFLVL